MLKCCVTTFLSHMKSLCDIKWYPDYYDNRGIVIILKPKVPKDGHADGKIPDLDKTEYG